MSKTILIVDDEQDIINLLKFNLLSEGYRTLTAQDGEAAIKTALAGKPDLIILDVMLPKMDGWAVIRELRNCNETRQTPIIFLTAKDSEIDEVVGLELGADDYIVKPIAIRKLLVRIKMALRKAAANRVVNQDRIVFDDIQIDPAGFAVFVGSSRLTLTKKEFEILLYLAQRPGRVITREMLLDVVWGDSVVVIDRTIDVHIRKIREKLGPERQHLIETIKGCGLSLQSARSLIMQGSLRYKFAVLQLALLAAMTVVTSLITNHEMQKYYKERLHKQAAGQLDEIRFLLANTDLGLSNHAFAESYLPGFCRTTGYRMTLIDSTGWVLFDSYVSADSLHLLTNHRFRPEIVAAEKQGWVWVLIPVAVLRCMNRCFMPLCVLTPRFRGRGLLRPIRYIRIAPVCCRD